MTHPPTPDATRRPDLFLPLALSTAVMISGFADTDITRPDLPGAPLLATGCGLAALLASTALVRRTRPDNARPGSAWLLAGVWLGASALKILPALLVLGPGGLHRAPLAELLIAGLLCAAGPLLPPPTARGRLLIAALAAAAIIAGLIIQINHIQQLI